MLRDIVRDKRMLEVAYAMRSKELDAGFIIAVIGHSMRDNFVYNAALRWNDAIGDDNRDAVRAELEDMLDLDEPLDVA